MNKIANGIYLLSLSLYLIMSFWSQTFLPAIFEGKINVAVLLVCLSLLFIKEVIYVKISIRTALIAFFMFLLGIISIYIFPSHKMLLVTMFYIFSARNVEYKKILDLSLLLSLAFLVIVVVCSAVGVIYDVVSLDLIAERERHYLGFRYVLIPAAMWSNIISLWMIKNRECFKWKEVFILALINQILFEYLNARLVYCLVYMNLFAVVVLKTRLNKILYSFWVRKLLLYAMPIACIFSFYVTVNYNQTDPFQYLINFLLEERLSLGQDALQTYGWPILGAPIVWIGGGLDENGFQATAAYNFVDCAYIQLLDYGFVTLAVFIYSIFKFLQNMERRNEIVVMIVFGILAIHSIIDDATIALQFNTCLLFLGSLIPSKSKFEI